MTQQTQWFVDDVPTDSPLFAELNPTQREAVAATEGPVLVVAGAGSGKTRVLTYRIAHLVRDLQVPPDAILAITFTNKAANEMKERVAALVGGAVRSMWVSTFHSACVRILRREASRLGYRSAFTIYDDADSLRLLRMVTKDLDLDSLSLLEIGVDVDYEFQLGLPEERMRGLDSVNDTLALVEERLRERQAEVA